MVLAGGDISSRNDQSRRAEDSRHEGTVAALVAAAGASGGEAEGRHDKESGARIEIASLTCRNRRVMHIHCLLVRGVGGVESVRVRHQMIRSKFRRGRHGVSVASKPGMAGNRVGPSARSHQARLTPMSLGRYALGLPTMCRASRLSTLGVQRGIGSAGACHRLTRVRGSMTSCCGCCAFVSPPFSGKLWR